jgi:chaperonin cofactor prefoldin
VSEIKKQAKNLFMQGRDPVEILDTISDLSPSTLYNWIKAGSWRNERENKILSQQQAGEILLDNLQKLIQRVHKITESLDNIDLRDADDPEYDPVKIAEAQSNAVAKFSDSISKITKSINTLFKQQDRLSQIIFSFGEFKNYISSQAKSFDDKFLLDLEKMLLGFQQDMIKKYSSKNG